MPMSAWRSASTSCRWAMKRPKRDPTRRLKNSSKNLSGKGLEKNPTRGWQRSLKVRLTRGSDHGDQGRLRDFLCRGGADPDGDDALGPPVAHVGYHRPGKHRGGTRGAERLLPRHVRQC